MMKRKVSIIITGILLSSLIFSYTTKTIKAYEDAKEFIEG